MRSVLAGCDNSSRGNYWRKAHIPPRTQHNPARRITALGLNRYAVWDGSSGYGYGLRPYTQLNPGLENSVTSNGSPVAAWDARQRAFHLTKELFMTTLRQRMIEDMQIRNLSPHTQESYVQQISQFARHFGKSPIELCPEDVRTHQVYWTTEKKLSPSSILIAVSAIRFLYKVTLKREWNCEDVIPTCKKPQKLPVILSPEEVLHFLNCVTSFKQRVF